MSSKDLSRIMEALALLLAAAPATAAERNEGAVLPGGNSKQPINIEAAKLDYYDKEQKLIYTGSVVATQGDSTLKSSVLTIFLAPKPAAAQGAAGQGSAAQGSGGQGSTGRVQRMLMGGPVTMTQRDQVETGDSGVYEKSSNTVVLTGHVVYVQGPNVTKGDKLVYDLKSGQAVVTSAPGSVGRVKSMFQPDDTPAAEASTAADAPSPRHGKARKATVAAGPR